MNKEIPVFFAVDNGYIPFLSVALRSLIDNTSKENIYAIKILYTSVTDENKEKIMLVCVARKREIHKIVEIVEEADKQAFMWIGDAREVMGEGFVNIA